MDVEITIHYSDDRLCTVEIARPDSGEILFRIVTPRGGIPQSIAEGLREAHRLFAVQPWTNRKPH